MKRYICKTNCSDFDHKEEGYCTMTELELEDTKRNKDNIIICNCGHIIELMEDVIDSVEIDYIVDFKNNKVTEEEFYKKFNQFINENGWSIEPNLELYRECVYCGKELKSESEQIYGYCYDCEKDMLEC